MPVEKALKRGRKSYWPKAETFVSIGVRLPKSIHGALTERAKTNFRSMNAELTWILSKEFGIDSATKNEGR